MGITMVISWIYIRYRSATYDRRLASRGRPHSIYKHSHLVIYLIKASLIHRPDKFIRQFRMICEPISRGRADKKPAFSWFITVDLISPSHVDKFIEKWIEWRYEFSIVSIILVEWENQLRIYDGIYIILISFIFTLHLKIIQITLGDKIERCID